MRSASLMVAPILVMSLLSHTTGAQRPTAQDPAAVDRTNRAEQRDDPRPAPNRHEGDGPFPRLVLRGATLIDGTGGPPRGPVDIVIEGNRIADVASVGVPGVPIDSSRRPRPA